MKAGPWSLEWVNKNRKDGAGGVVKSTSIPPLSFPPHAPRVTRKKGGGYLRHCAQSLKRIARLSVKDRQEVLRVLRKNEKKRKRMTASSKALGSSGEGFSQAESQSLSIKI